MGLYKTARIFNVVKIDIEINNMITIPYSTRKKVNGVKGSKCLNFP
jgi:hypothetical protein